MDQKVALVLKNSLRWKLQLYEKRILIIYVQDMCGINDPLSQTHIHASSDHYSRLKFVFFGEILKSGDGRTRCAKSMIPTGRDYGLAE